MKPKGFMCALTENATTAIFQRLFRTGARQSMFVSDSELVLPPITVLTSGYWLFTGCIVLCYTFSYHRHDPGLLVTCRGYLLVLYFILSPSHAGATGYSQGVSFFLHFTTPPQLGSQPRHPYHIPAVGYPAPTQKHLNGTMLSDKVK